MPIRRVFETRLQKSSTFSGTPIVSSLPRGNAPRGDVPGRHLSDRARATTPSFSTHSSILRGGRARGVDAKRASPNTRALDHTSTFADAVAGEWIGHCASFDPRTGNASSLPSHLVPDAFREWGMEIKDWQSQCSTTTRADGNALYVKDARFVLVFTVMIPSIMF